MNAQQAANYLDIPNVRAFLDMIGFSEGADYETLVHKGRNNKAIKDLSKHPNTVVKTDASGRAVKSSLWSSAAGKYQFLAATWKRFSTDLPDFSPRSQDLAAIKQLSETGSLPLIVAGRTAEAITKARKVWASFPNAGYGQGENSLAKLLGFYNSRLGKASSLPTTTANAPEKKRI